MRRVGSLVAVLALLGSGCGGSRLVEIGEWRWRFALLAYQRTELQEGTAILRSPWAVRRASDILQGWVPRADWAAVEDAGTVTRVSWYPYSPVFPDCPRPFAALGPGDAPVPGGYHGYVGLWAPPAGLPTCAGGWAWAARYWAQVYEYPGHDPTEGLLHELAHLVEWHAQVRGYHVLGVDNAKQAGYSCEPTPQGCSWMRFLRDYYTGRFEGAIPEAFWSGQWNTNSTPPGSDR